MLNYAHYGEKADDEWCDFVRSNPRPHPPENLIPLKESFNTNRAALFQKVLGPVEGLQTKDVLIPCRDGQTISGRLYLPEDASSCKRPMPLHIYVHGGGFLLGSLETEDMHCRLLAVGVPCIVFSVGYRHTPDWTFPTPFHDIFDAVDWITEASHAEQYGIDLGKVVLGGTSAGATMSIAGAVREIEQETFRLRGLNVSCPSPVSRSRFPHHLIEDGCDSYTQMEDGPVLSTGRLQYFQKLLKPDPDSPYISPLLLPDSFLARLPSIAFQVCGMDPVRDGGLLFEEKLRHLNVPTRLEVYAGWPHTFWNQPELRKAAEYRQKFIDDARWLFDSPARA